MTTQPSDSVSRRPIRVLHCDHTARMSGGEIALLRVLVAMDSSVVDSTVVLAEDGDFRRALVRSGVKVVVEPLDPSVREVRKDAVGLRLAGKVRPAVALLRHAGQLARLARRSEIDVVHTNSLKADVYGGIAGRLARIPVVWHMRDHIDTTYLPPKAVFALRALARRLPHHVVANSASTMERLLPAHSGNDTDRSTTIHDGMDPPGGGAWPAEPPEPPRNNPPVVGIVGRITRWKGQHVFIEAAHRVIGRGIAARFVVVGEALFGEDDYAAELRRMVRDFGLGEQVIFTGFSDRVHDTMRSLDVFVHASVSPEPFGQVVIEAMAAGVPVIAAGAGGVREIVEDGVSGILVPPNDPEALSSALVALLSDRKRSDALAKAGYARMASQFTASRTARSLERVFSRVVERG